MYQRTGRASTLLLLPVLAVACGDGHNAGQEVGPKGGRPSYEFIPDRQERGKGRLVFRGAPAHVHALPMCPPALEEEVKRGPWLVLAFNWGSQPDMNCIREALEVALEHRGAFSLGVRPFFLYEEPLTWFPQYEDAPGRSPLWVFYRDGRVVHWEAGPLQADEIQALVKPFLLARKAG